MALNTKTLPLVNIEMTFFTELFTYCPLCLLAHSATTNFLHLLRSSASWLSWFHVFPTLFTSASSRVSAISNGAKKLRS